MLRVESAGHWDKRTGKQVGDSRGVHQLEGWPRALRPPSQGQPHASAARAVVKALCLAECSAATALKLSSFGQGTVCFHWALETMEPASPSLNTGHCVAAFCGQKQ